MPTLADISQDHLFCLFKGEPGTRKSTQALSFPTPQYWFSTDQKMDALITPAKKWGVNFKDINHDDYTTWTKIRTKLESLQVNCPYKTVIIDSITSHGDVINLETKRIKMGTKNQQGGEKGMKIGAINVNSMEDYKAEAAAFQELIAITKDIQNFHKVNIILIAHVIGARKPEEANPQTHFSRIIVTGGQIISAKIPAYCSEVYHFNVEPDIDVNQEGSYGLYTVHTGHDFARTSLPLPRKILFKDKPLYDTYIRPAIEKNKNEPALTKI